MAPPARATESSPHIRKKRRRRRDEILHSALETFRDKGYHRTTLEDIANRLGLRNTALYHYFPDKEAILYECHRQSLDQVVPLVEEARVGYGTAADQLAYVIREHVRVMTETLEGSPLAFEIPELAPEHQAEVVAARDRYEHGLREIVAAGVRRGEFRDVDPKMAVFAILGAINWIARWYRPEGSVRGAELGEEFAQYLVGGLTCRD